VVGIEQWGKACGVIQANWQGLASADQTIEVIRGDVVRWLPKLQGPFDFIYFDPPYQSGLYGSVVGSIATLALLHPQGELAIEHDPKYPISVPTSLTVCRHKIYGNTALTLLQVGT
jgi:16S rRNA G966 N2-methylase RsmD